MQQTDDLDSMQDIVQQRQGGIQLGGESRWLKD